MLRIILRRVLFALPLLLITSVITFILQALVPGDPARAIVGMNGTPEQYEAVRQQLNLDLPLWQQYLTYLGNALHGDLGSSLFTGEPVTHALATRVPVTLAVVIGATLVFAIVGVLLGVASARLGGWTARVVDVVSLLGLALPNFWLALLLVAAFAIAIPLFPAIGYVPFEQSPSLWFSSLVLPVLALALGGVAQVSKMSRDGVSDAMEQEYIRTLRAAGVSERSLLWKHGLKNAGVSIVTVIGLGFVGALAGSLFVENVFVLPGLGNMLSDATSRHDIPMIQGVALAYATIVILLNLVIDIVYTVINPKVRIR